jgi:hypothetical protein
MGCDAVPFDRRVPNCQIKLLATVLSEFLLVVVKNISAVMYIIASYVMPCGLVKLFRHFREAHYVASSEMSVHFCQNIRQHISKSYILHSHSCMNTENTLLN